MSFAASANLGIQVVEPGPLRLQQRPCQYERRHAGPGEARRRSAGADRHEYLQRPTTILAGAPCSLATSRTATGALATTGLITDNGTLLMDDSGTVTQGTQFNGAGVSGSGGLIQAGGGTLVLNAANTYTGPTTITSGAKSS